MVENSKEMELKEQGASLVNVANDMIVNDADSLRVANDFIIQARKGKKGVSAFFKEMRENAHKAWKTICNKEKSISDVFAEADAIVSKKIIAHRAEQKRIADEAARKAEEERQERERRDQEKLLKRAEKAEAKGDTEKADMLAEQATQVQAPPIVHEPAVKKTEVADTGAVTGVKDWAVKVINPSSVIRAVADGKLPETVLTINESKIKQWARMMDVEQYQENGLFIKRTERLAAKATR